MKNLGVFCLLLTAFTFVSCKNNQAEKNPEVNQVEELTNVQCYKAINEGDTLDLKINTFKSGKITGNMDMAMVNMPKKIGEIAGEFKGDTLFVNYTFIQGENKDLTFKNPMAFLKRDNQLILGNGKLQTTLGETFFVKGEPIDFDRVKFKFDAVDCVSK